MNGIAMREHVADGANKVGRESRRSGAPVLDAGSSAETLVAWLRWNDPNGTHAVLRHVDGDALCERGRCSCEGYETVGEAWDAIAETLDEAGLL